MRSECETVDFNCDYMKVVVQDFYESQEYLVGDSQSGNQHQYGCSFFAEYLESHREIPIYLSKVI